jgi:predicted ferric reductase
MKAMNNRTVHPDRMLLCARRAVPVLRLAGITGAGYAAAGLLLAAAIWFAAALGQPQIAARLPWYLSRGAGITAYLLLTATTVFGLAVSTRAADRWLARPVVFSLHEYLSWLGLAATGLHVSVLLGDTYLPFSVGALLLPFAAPYRPGAVTLGLGAWYLGAAITASFYLRPWLGRRAWRALHTLSFVTYALATAHGILAGSSTGQVWMQWLYLGSGGTVLLLTNYRVLLARRRFPRPHTVSARLVPPRLPAERAAVR